jgi:hypothetical protein
VSVEIISEEVHWEITDVNNATAVVDVVTVEVLIEGGPSGPQGPTGATGATGPAGANGTNGTNGVGVPVGGTTDQVLKKNSNTDYDTSWGTGGGAAPSQDIYSYSFFGGF